MYNVYPYLSVCVCERVLGALGTLGTQESQAAEEQWKAEGEEAHLRKPDCAAVDRLPFFLGAAVVSS